ncbi:MAG: GGDEF domain-containing protein [Candidatus Diapherotrites archaeon]|nr:GGDEF domain-containing protein [Candidatus Diapherotrites archaeon]
MPAKKPRSKQTIKTIRYRPGQRAKPIRTITAAEHFLQRYPRKYMELREYYENIIKRLERSKKLDKRKREELRQAWENLQKLNKKFAQMYVPRAQQLADVQKRDPKFRVFLTDRYFKERMWFEAKQHRENSLAFIDIDHLKEINDVFGHKTGDIVIRTLGKALSEAVGKKGGLVGRHGGEEILVWAPVTPKQLAELLQKAARLAQEKAAEELWKYRTKSQRIKQAPIEIPSPVKRKLVSNFPNIIRFSAGIVSVPSFKTREEFRKAYAKAVENADELLYRSKRKKNAYTLKVGKNLVTEKLI